MTDGKRWRLAELVLLVIWGLVLVRLLVPGVGGTVTGALLMGLYIAFALFDIRRRTLILCTGLTLVGVAFAYYSNSWGLIVEALNTATIFTAFFGTITVLRATAELRSETEKARQVFAELSQGQQSGAFLIGGHFTGAILIVGAMAVLAPILGDKATEDARLRAALSTMRGLCLASLWSPFWIAMAITSQYLPDVDLWQIFAFGIPLSVLGLVMAHVMYSADTDIRELWRSLNALSVIALPVAVCSLVVVLLTTLTDLTTLQSVVVGIPVLCMAALASAGGGVLRQMLGRVYGGLHRIADEVVLVTVALALGKVVGYTLTRIGLAEAYQAVDLPQELLIVGMVSIITLASLVGVHQLVTITVLLGIVVPMANNVADVVVMEAALLGWALASMVGITAVAVAGAGAMFRVPRDALSFGPNLKFVLVYGIAAVLILMLANRIMIGTSLI